MSACAAITCSRGSAGSRGVLGFPAAATAAAADTRRPAGEGGDGRSESLLQQVGRESILTSPLSL